MSSYRYAERLSPELGDGDKKGLRDITRAALLSFRTPNIRTADCPSPAQRPFLICCTWVHGAGEVVSVLVNLASAAI